jgi:hypothetical protein
MAGRAVLNGRYAEASVGGILIALLFDWKVTVSGKVIELPIGGDTWDYLAPLRSGWTFSAKGYMVPGSANHYVKALWAANTTTPYFVIEGFSGSVQSGTPIFQGTGLPVRGEIAAPMELVTQEFEIRGHGAPTIGVT